MKIIPSKGTIDDLRKQANAYEAKSESTEEPEKSKLKDLAEQCREWAAALRTGKWTS